MSSIFGSCASKSITFKFKSPGTNNRDLSLSALMAIMRRSHLSSNPSFLHTLFAGGLLAYLIIIFIIPIPNLLCHYVNFCDIITPGLSIINSYLQVLFH